MPNANNNDKFGFFDYLDGKVGVIVKLISPSLALFIYLDNRFNMKESSFHDNPTFYALLFSFIFEVIFIYFIYRFAYKKSNLSRIGTFFKKNRRLIFVISLGILIYFIVSFIVNSIFNLEDNSVQKNGIELREDTKEDDKHWTDPRGILDSLDCNSKGIFLYNDTVEVKAEAKDYTRSHDIEGSFGTSNNNSKDEVADTKRKLQLPNEEGLADIRLFPLPEDGYIFLGIVREKDGKKIWITKRPGNPFDVGDVFTEDYPSMKIFIEANRCNIYDNKIINNGHIVAFDTEYRVIQNIQLETLKEGDYNAWLFVELKK